MHAVTWGTSLAFMLLPLTTDSYGPAGASVSYAYAATRVVITVLIVLPESLAARKRLDPTQS